MRNCKIKTLTVLVTSLVALNACNSGSGSPIAKTNSSVNISVNTYWGETIRAVYKDGSVMFVAGDDTVTPGGSILSIIFPGHNGEAEEPYNTGTREIKYTSPITAIKLSPSQVYLYVTTHDNLYTYKYNYSEGTLQLLQQIPLPVLALPNQPPSKARVLDIAVDATNTNLFLLDNTNNLIWDYRILHAEQIIFLIPQLSNSVSTGLGPMSFIVNGFNVYVANSQSNNISQYTYAANEQGADILTPMPAVNGGSNPTGMAIKGNYLYLTQFGTNTIAKYSISSQGGGLTYVDTFKSNGHNPSAIYINKLGTYAYVFNSNFGHDPSKQNISQYTISSNGDLRLIPNEPNIKNPNSATNMSMTMDDNAHVYTYDTRIHSLEMYSTSANGSFSADVNNKDFCNYNTNFYTASGISTTVNAPPCAAYVTLVAVGGGGGNGGSGSTTGGGGGGGGATSYWTDSEGNILVEGGGGGGGGGGDGNGHYGGGVGGGGGVAYLYNMALVNPSITSLTGYVGAHGFNGTDANFGSHNGGPGGAGADGVNGIAGWTSGDGNPGSGSNGDGGWGGAGDPTTQLPAGVTQQPGGVPQVTNGLNGLTLCGTIACTGLPNNTGLPNPPNYTFNNSNTQGVVGVLFTTYQIPENPWIPGGDWTTYGGCVVSPVFLQNYINWPGRPYQGAVQYVCPQSGKYSFTGNDRNYTQGWLYLPLDNDNPEFYNNSSGTPTQK